MARLHKRKIAVWPNNSIHWKLQNTEDPTVVHSVVSIHCICAVVSLFENGRERKLALCSTVVVSFPNPFFPFLFVVFLPPQIKTEKSGLGMRLAQLYVTDHVKMGVSKTVFTMSDVVLILQ